MNQITLRRIEDHQDLVLDLFGGQNFLLIVPKARDLGDVTEDRAISPNRATRNDGHHPNAQRLKLLETVFILQNIDGLELCAVINQKLFGLQATGTPGLPVNLQWLF